MKKETAIIVKKAISHRVALFVFGMIPVIVLLFEAFRHEENRNFLLFAAMMLPWLLFCMYYSKWEIVFTPSLICKKTLFSKKTYLYSQITDAVRAYSNTDSAYVRLFFSNGDYLTILYKYENASRAIALVCKHVSIRSMWP